MSSRVDNLARTFGDATARIQALLRKEMARNVSLAQARTLATLEREGPQPLTALAELEQVSQPAMSYLVARLELKGQIRRSSDSGDARVVIVSITSAGRTALNGLLQRRTALLARHLSKLPSGEVDALEAALPVLSNLILGLEDRTAVGATR
jgi:DNA-binding MarR family transcriptional regulator